VEVPDADVAGEVRWPGGSLSLAGRGYRDRVWMDLPPWSFPVRELEWGRIAAGAHASTWVRAATTEEAVTVGWLDGRAAPVGECLGELGEDRVLVESRVVDREGLRLGMLRPLFRRLSGDPLETKWACPATLRGERGSAIHERVRWR
jgi:hypothetical protein